MTPCYFLIPGLSEKYRTGGLMVIQEVSRILEKSGGYSCSFIRTEEEGEIPMDTSREALYFVTWGPLVSKHIALIRARAPHARIIYYAQSFGWGITVPHDVPIVCVSRFVMAQWALQRSHEKGGVCAYIPPPLHEVFTLPIEGPAPRAAGCSAFGAQAGSLGEGGRDIDVLVHERKQNVYCLKILVPGLESAGLRVQRISGWIDQEDFAKLLQRSKLFVYITAPHKAGFRRWLPGEGFGLPALEAVACGTRVASNLLGGVTDFLTPGENCVSLNGHNHEKDVILIHEALKAPALPSSAALHIREHYSEAAATQRWVDFLK